MSNIGGRSHPGLAATCSQCRHRVECEGRGHKAEEGLLRKMRDECPRERRNTYVSDTCG